MAAVLCLAALGPGPATAGSKPNIVLCMSGGIASQAPSMEAVRGKPASRRPNIVLITSEDNGAHLSCYGDPHVRTPHLDKLAGQGVRFVNAYVTQAGCSQSRASIFTGLYPH